MHALWLETRPGVGIFFAILIELKEIKSAMLGIWKSCGKETVRLGAKPAARELSAMGINQHQVDAFSLGCPNAKPSASGGNVRTHWQSVL